MTTSPETLWKSASSLEDEPFEPAALGYIHSLAQDEAHEVVLTLFQKLAAEQGLTRAFIARRLGKSPEQITRWLSAPGNWTLDTFANLLLAMGHLPNFGATRMSEMRQSNHSHPAIDRLLHSRAFEAVSTEPKSTAGDAPLNIGGQYITSNSAAVG